MDENNKKIVAQKLSILQGHYRSRLQSRVDEMQQLWDKLLQDGWGLSVAREFYRLAHNLAGSAGSFGFAEIGQLAHNLEEALAPFIVKATATPDDITIKWLTQKLANLSNVLSGIASSKTDQIKTDDLYDRIHDELGEKIYVVDENSVFAEDLCNDLKKSGYQTQCFETPQAMIKTCDAESPPAAIISEMNFRGDPMAGINAIRDLKKTHREVPPVIFMSGRVDINGRLAAARIGIECFVAKPLISDQLISVLDKLVVKHQDHPYRVLLIDDDADLSAYHSAILNEVGIETRLITDPLKCLDVMHEFLPDLILLDIYMPGCTGLELASVIRQDDSFVHMPIVFLSTETAQEQQWRAMSLGGDDFLTKPVKPVLFLRLIVARIARARRLGAIDRDLKAALIESEAHQQALGHHAIVSITDADGIITDVNEKFVEISGYSRDELIGQNHRIINSGVYPKAFYKELWDTISSGKVWQGEVCNRRKDGSLYWVESTVVPFLDGDGVPFKYYAVRTDITAIKEAEEALRASEARLSRSQEFANIGTWDWDIATGELFWSDRIGHLFGYGDQVPETSYESYMAAIHPEDRDTVTKAISACVDKGEEYNIEHRVVWPDGSIHWLHESGDVVRADDGEPLHMLGVVQDITERTHLKQEADKQNHLLGMLRHAMTHFVSSADLGETADYLLDSLLTITESEYGFVGEVRLDEEGDSYLVTHAVSNIAWDDKTRKFYEAKAPQGLEFRNLDTLLGEAMKTNEPVIANDPVNDERSSGLPEGHPVLNSFLGVPIHYSNRVVGMYGIANRAGGYADEMVKFLRPFDATYGAIINADRIMKAQKQTNLALDHSRVEAERANRSKSEFLSRMSHELRTPLNAVLGFAQLLETEKLDDSQLESVGEIIRAGGHLLTLINDVLDLAKVESGSIEMSPEPVLFRDLLMESLSLISSMAKEHDISIRLFQGEREIALEVIEEIDDVVLRADRTRLKQVMINLLSNAIKYNRDHGWLGIHCDKKLNGFARISISDSGAGIAAENLPHMFSSFSRLGAEKSNIEGTGIGLVICKNIIESMNGTIGVESELGKGSQFWIELPLDDSAPLEEQEVGISVSPFQQLHEDKIAATVLYIEDNPANLKLVEGLMHRREGVRLLTAKHPVEGLAVAEAYRPDLILLDINLPDMDGYEVLKRLQTFEGTKEIPVIAISANAMPRDVRKGDEAGFRNYLTKPLDVTQFFEAVDKVLY